MSSFEISAEKPRSTQTEERASPPAPPARPLVSVIIPHYNDLQALDLCLTRLEQQTLPRDRYEIVVADNASPQGEAAVLAAIRGRARLVVVHERGAGPARNGAVAASQGEILAFTDSDCAPEPEWLTGGLEGLKRYDFVGGRVRVSAADPERMTATEAFERVFAFNFEHYIKHKRFTGSGNLFCARRLFDAVGPFRVGVSEDVDWSHRALAAGFSLGYEKDAVIWHPARRTWAELQGKWRRVNRESFGLIGGRPRARLMWLLKACALPASAFVHSARVLASPELSSPRERLLALSMLFRLRFWRAWDSLCIMLAAKKAA